MKKAQAQPITKEKCTQVAAILKNLAHPGRLMILCLLCEMPRSVGELEEKCGISQSAVSQFLHRMKLEGLVDCEREGRNILYEVSDPNILKIIQSLHKIFCAS